MSQRRLLISQLTLLLLPVHAVAAAPGPHFEDKLADVLVWVVIILGPIIAIGAFLMVHIIPEKIAAR